MVSCRRKSSRWAGLSAAVVVVGRGWIHGQRLAAVPRESELYACLAGVFCKDTGEFTGLDSELDAEFDADFVGPKPCSACATLCVTPSTVSRRSALASRRRAACADVNRSVDLLYAAQALEAAGQTQISAMCKRNLGALRLLADDIEGGIDTINSALESLETGPSSQRRIVATATINIALGAGEERRVFVRPDLYLAGVPDLRRVRRVAQGAQMWSTGGRLPVLPTSVRTAPDPRHRTHIGSCGLVTAYLRRADAPRSMNR